MNGPPAMRAIKRGFGVCSVGSGGPLRTQAFFLPAVRGEIPRRTENRRGNAAHGRYKARRGRRPACIRPRSHAGSRDAAPFECSEAVTTACSGQVRGVALVQPRVDAVRAALL